MKYHLILEVPALPKSLNKKLRSHFRANHKENQSWDFMIASLCAAKGRPAKPLERAMVQFVRHSYRMLDFDGLVGSLKPAMDALVSAGILKDDSWAVTGPWQVDQVFRRKVDGPLLTINISELET